MHNARCKSSAKSTARLRIYASMETPATRLTQLREKAGFKTATEAARYFGWNKNTYIQHENGTRDISRKAASRYAQAFHSSMDFLLEGKSHTLIKNDIIQHFVLFALDFVPCKKHYSVIGSKRSGRSGDLRSLNKRRRWPFLTLEPKCLTKAEISCAPPTHSPRYRAPESTKGGS